MKRETYQVVASRHGKWWTITVPEVPGTFSQARRLDQVEDQARDALALMLDVDDKSFDVVVEFRLDEGLEAARVGAINSTQVAAATQAEAAEAQRQFVEAARPSLSLRDTAILLGVSHQRVAQIERRRNNSQP